MPTVDPACVVLVYPVPAIFPLATVSVTTSGVQALVDWSTDPSWTSATITARGALIYNSSKSNKSVAVIDFGTDKTSTAGTFTVVLPAATASNALIRIE